MYIGVHFNLVDPCEEVYIANLSYALLKMRSYINTFWSVISDITTGLSTGVQLHPYGVFHYIPRVYVQSWGV